MLYFVKSLARRLLNIFLTCNIRTDTLNRAFPLSNGKDSIFMCFRSEFGGLGNLGHNKKGLVIKIFIENNLNFF